MKKLAILAALASLGAAAAVESSNTVGYYTKSIANGKFGQLAVQFEAVGGGNAKVTDLFKSEDLVATEAEFDSNYEVTSDSLKAAPQIQVWDGNKYTIYYYFSNAWDSSLNDGEGGEVTAWADGLGGNVVTDTLKPGQGVWVKATTSAASVIQAGQVYDGSYTKSAAKGKFVMLCNTRPEALDPNDSAAIDFGELAAVEAEFDSNYEVTSDSLKAAPQIQVWDGNKYTIYYYFSNAWDTSLNDGEGGEVTAWADGLGGNVATGTIPVGQGFWLKATTAAATVTINE